jgi:hypothetical protein
MRRRRSKEGIQSNTLMELGFGQDVPFDNFSDQPDSGGRIGGVRGKQEYGRRRLRLLVSQSLVPKGSSSQKS